MDKRIHRQERLLQLIEERANGKQSKFAELVDIASTSISRMLYPAGKAGAKAITEKTTDKIERILGLPMGWFDSQNGETLSFEHVSPIKVTAKKTGDDFFIPIYNATASMGHGMTASEFEMVVDCICVNRAWLRRELPQVTSLSNLQIIAGIGDSMSPTYDSGDLLLVDTGVKNITSDLIYVFSYKDATYVKRIFVNPVASTINVKSDNKNAGDWPAIPMSDIDDFTIHGRVIYAWSGKKL